MDEFILLGICVVIFILVIFFYIKDKQADKKFARYDSVITEHMQEIFILKKENAELKKRLDKFDLGDFSDMIENQIEEKITPVLMSLQSVDSLIKKKISTDDDNAYIISEFKSGKTIDEIALQSNIDIDKIEFILKFHKLI